ncbi:MAG: AAA family ATPase, partial [Deltaproteobacteria bacterium]|nr:AAA family ATPase [Deltaproteobacteria bacterium]
MKILKLRIKNLNSLLGEWEIDFTATPFTAEGIFAITGPTGAGKSTILDALCLALYGQTPRLGRITGSTNEIMSRQAGECLAEATFATRAGTFRCCWSQHRAHKKPDGELQNPRHEIVNDKDGRVITSKLRDVVDKVEKVTGLDFERFTRSMLLAQGSFAVFLKARPDERAPILEQITGTGIYSRVSIMVHERRGDERRKLELLESALEGLQPLGEDEEQKLKLELEEKSGRAGRLNRELEAADRALNWLDQLAEVERERAELDREQEEWQKRNQEFAGFRLKLREADRARELAPAGRELELRRQETK